MYHLFGGAAQRARAAAVAADAAEASVEAAAAAGGPQRRAERVLVSPVDVVDALLEVWHAELHGGSEAAASPPPKLRFEDEAHVQRAETLTILRSVVSAGMWRRVLAGFAERAGGRELRCALAEWGGGALVEHCALVMARRGVSFHRGGYAARRSVSHAAATKGRRRSRSPARRSASKKSGGGAPASVVSELLDLSGLGARYALLTGASPPPQASLLKRGAPTRALSHGGTAATTPPQLLTTGARTALTSPAKKRPPLSGARRELLTGPGMRPPPALPQAPPKRSWAPALSHYEVVFSDNGRTVRAGATSRSRRHLVCAAQEVDLAGRAGFVWECALAGRPCGTTVGVVCAGVKVAQQYLGMHPGTYAVQLSPSSAVGCPETTRCSKALGDFLGGDRLSIVYRPVPAGGPGRGELVFRRFSQCLRQPRKVTMTVDVAAVRAKVGSTLCRPAALLTSADVYLTHRPGAASPEGRPASVPSFSAAGALPSQVCGLAGPCLVLEGGGSSRASSIDGDAADVAEERSRALTLTDVSATLLESFREYPRQEAPCPPQSPERPALCHGHSL